MAGTPSRRRVARMDGTASALAPASKVSAITRLVVGMTVQSLPASQPVTGRVPGDAGLVADGRGDGVAGGTALAGVPRGEVTGGEAGDADVLSAGVVPVPWLRARRRRAAAGRQRGHGRAGHGKPGDQGGPHAVSMRRAGRARSCPKVPFPASMVIKQDFRPASRDAWCLGRQAPRPTVWHAALSPLVPMEGMKNEPDRAVPAGHQPARWPARRCRRGSGWRRCACSGVRIPRADGPRHSAPAVPVFGPAP